MDEDYEQTIRTIKNDYDNTKPIKELEPTDKENAVRSLADIVIGGYPIEEDTSRCKFSNMQFPKELKEELKKAVDLPFSQAVDHVRKSLDKHKEAFSCYEMMKTPSAVVFEKEAGVDN